MVQLHDLSATQVIEGLDAGRFSSLELVDALIARCGEQATLNAFVDLGVEAIREAARAADQRRASGLAGALTGLPVTFKDNIAVAGQPCAAGTPALMSYRPDKDAQVARRLFAAGAIAFGRNGMHELALGATSNNKRFGAVRNPHRLDRVPGGSSGGTAAAVAGRLVPVGIGTDTGGSVRLPASLCGVYGFRPTTGRWPTTGIVPLSRTRDTPGPISRSVSDLALLDLAATGDWSGVTPRSIKGARIGVPRTGFWSALDPEVEAACRSALDRLAADGAVLVEVEVAGLLAVAAEISFVIAMFEARSELAQFLAELDSGLSFDDLLAGVAGEDVRAVLGSETAGAAVAYRTAMDNGLPALRQYYRALFASDALDAMAFPTTPILAPPIGADMVMTGGQWRPTFQTLIRNTDPGACAGVPGISLPCGIGREGLPIGLSLDADFGADRRLLGLGLAMEPLFPLPSLPLHRPDPQGSPSALLISR